MTIKNSKIEYQELSAGYEFPASIFTLDAGAVSDYLEAVQNTSPLFDDKKTLPPMVIAARAMAALSEGFNLPPGSVHVSQELQFKKPAVTGESFTSLSKVERKQDRGKFRMLTIDLTVLNDKQEAVVTGKTSFILPVTG